MCKMQDEFCVECGLCVDHCKCDDNTFNPTKEDIDGWTCSVCKENKVSQTNRANTLPELKHYIIGQARTIETAVHVVEYLKKRCASECRIHPDYIKYRFKNATPSNGHWFADIIVDYYENLPHEASTLLVNTCRAFVAGRGEVWT